MAGMVLKIEDVPERTGTTLKLIGRISSPEVQVIKARVAEVANPVALDLQQVRILDLDGARYLAAAERRGIELRHIPPYVREWVSLERNRLLDLE